MKRDTRTPCLLREAPSSPSPGSCLRPCGRQPPLSVTVPGGRGQPGEGADTAPAPGPAPACGSRLQGLRGGRVLPDAPRQALPRKTAGPCPQEPWPPAEQSGALIPRGPGPVHTSSSQKHSHPGSHRAPQSTWAPRVRHPGSDASVPSGGLAGSTSGGP